MKKFDFLSRKDESKLSQDELIEYYAKVQAFYKAMPISRVYQKFVKAMRPMLLKEAAKMMDFEIVYLNDIKVPEKGYILATNHKGFNDIPALLEIMGENEPINILMATDNPMPLKTRILLFLMGAIKLSRLDKTEKKNALDKASALGAQGYLPAYYPEAVNNFTDSTPLYHFWRGFVRNAKNSNLPIVQIATFDKDDKMYVMCGKPFRVNVYDNEDIIATILRDEMFSMLWEIKQIFPQITRKQALAEYEPRCLTKDGLTFRPEYEEQFLYRPVNPYSPTSEKELTEKEALRIITNGSKALMESPCFNPKWLAQNRELASKIREDTEMTRRDCENYDIKKAQQETIVARQERQQAYTAQIGLNEYSGAMRTIRRKA